MMNTNHILGLCKILYRRPHSLSVITQNVTHRLTHPITKLYKQGWSAPPEQITLVITDCCNLRCQMCHFAHSDSPGYQLNRMGNMPPQLFHKLMDEVPGHPLISFTGGEPLLHREIAEFVLYAKRQGRLCTLTTNGWLLEQRAGELCQAGLDLLVVSVDGPPEIHDRIRGNGSFERLLAGLKAVLAQPNRPITFVTMSISDLNDNQLIQMYDLARSWGVDGINFNHLWMQLHTSVDALRTKLPFFASDEVAWDIHPDKVDTEVLARALATIRQRSAFSSLIVTQTPDLSWKDIHIWYHQPERFVKYTSTRCAWTRMKVWPNGDVKPCREWVTGNVSHKHAMEVWDDEKFRGFRQVLAAQKALPICVRCCYMAHR